MMEEDVRRTGPKPRSKPLKPPKKKPAPKPTDEWQRGRNFQISQIRSQTGLVGDVMAKPEDITYLLVMLPSRP
jgi:hypothetical protein